jgi:hypothetical protein
MDILSAIVGGFLAAGTGWFLQTRLEASRQKKIKELLLIGMSDDLRNSLELYVRLEEDWEKSRVIWFTTINELTESRHIYTNNKDWITLIKNEELRKNILKYYRKSANHLIQLQNTQQRKYDIQNRFNAQVQELRIKNPTLELKEAQDQVAIIPYVSGYLSPRLRIKY